MSYLEKLQYKLKIILQGDSCSRIVQTYGGALLAEIESKTLYVELEKIELNKMIKHLN